MFHILIAEKDGKLRRQLGRVLQKKGYHTTGAADGAAALTQIDREFVDLMIAGTDLAHIDGFELTRQLRETGYTFPILLSSDRDAFPDKKKGFELGADDYMVSPVDVEELTLRVQALLRRSNSIHARQIHTGTTVLDYDSLTLSTRDVSWSLPQKEFLLLYKLASYPGKIFTRQQLIDEIWGLDSESDIRTVDVHINRLRERLKYNPDLDILTVRGLGYKAVNRVM